MSETEEDSDFIPYGEHTHSPNPKKSEPEYPLMVRIGAGICMFLVLSVVVTVVAKLILWIVGL